MNVLIIYFLGDFACYVRLEDGHEQRLFFLGDIGGNIAGQEAVAVMVFGVEMGVFVT